MSLVNEDNVQEFIEKLASVYHAKVGLNAEFYVADIGDGVRKNLLSINHNNWKNVEHEF